MGMTNNKVHYHYQNEERFVVLAENLFRALVRHHVDKGMEKIPEGQYLVLHRVRDGEYYIPLIVHVVKRNSGREAYIHPIPVEKKKAKSLAAFGLHTPYGRPAFRFLERALQKVRDVRPQTTMEDLILERIGTRRSVVQYPPMREHADGYVAQKLLQEVAPDTKTYNLSTDRVFVLDYHKHDDLVELRLEPYSPNRHSPVVLDALWPEYFDPVAHVDPETFERIHREVRRGGRQAHL